MKVKVTDNPKDYEGKPLMEGPNKLTFRDLIVAAVNNFLRDEIQLEKDKLMSYQISTKCYQKSSPEFSSKEVAYIIERSGKVQNPMVYGRMKEFFGEPAQVDSQ